MWRHVALYIQCHIDTFTLDALPYALHTTALYHCTVVHHQTTTKCSAPHPMWMHLKYTYQNVKSRSTATQKWHYAHCCATNVANSCSDLPFISYTGARKPSLSYRVAFFASSYIYHYDTIPACDTWTCRHMTTGYTMLAYHRTVKMIMSLPRTR